VLGCDRQLARAFDNVIRNAIEAVDPGGHVWVEIRRDVGLPIAQHFLTAHCGSIEITPGQPRGTVVRIRIPIAGAE